MQLLNFRKVKIGFFVGLCGEFGHILASMHAQHQVIISGKTTARIGYQLIICDEFYIGISDIVWDKACSSD